MALNNTGRNITFRGAGDNDVSEVILSTGTNDVARGDLNSRISYTVSYSGPPGDGSGGYQRTPEQEKEIAEAITEVVKNKLSEFQI